MKKHLLFAAVAALCAVFACDKPEPEPTPGPDVPNPPVTEEGTLTLYKSNLILGLGDELFLEPFLETNKTFDSLTVTTSDPGVVVMTEDYKIKAVDIGNATLTFTLGNKSETLGIEVENGFLFYCSSGQRQEGSDYTKVFGEVYAGDVMPTNTLEIINREALLGDRTCEVVQILGEDGAKNHLCKEDCEGTMEISGVSPRMVGHGAAFRLPGSKRNIITREFKAFIAVGGGKCLNKGDQVQLGFVWSPIYATITDIGSYEKLDGGYFRDITFSFPSDVRLVLHVGELLTMADFGTCWVTDITPCEGVDPDETVFTFTKESLVLGVGQIINPALFITSNCFPDEYTLTSSNPDVVAVDALGELDAITEGTATISATCFDKTASIDVKVENGFLMYPSSTGQLPDEDVRVSGQPVSGHISVGEPLQVINRGSENSDYLSNVSQIINGQQESIQEFVHNNDFIKLYLEGLLPKHIDAGAALITPGSESRIITREVKGYTYQGLKNKYAPGDAITLSPVENFVNINATIKELGDNPVNKGFLPDLYEVTIVLPENERFVSYVGQSIPIYDGTDRISSMIVTDVIPCEGVQPDDVQLNFVNNKITIAQTDTLSLVPFIETSVDFADLTIRSSNTDVIVISNDNRMIAKGLGTTTITASYLNSVTTMEVEVENGFLIYVDLVTALSGRGTVGAGTVIAGEISSNDEVKIAGPHNQYYDRSATCTGIELFRKQVDHAQKGDNAGILLRGIPTYAITKGTALTLNGGKRNIVAKELTGYMMMAEGKSMSLNEASNITVGGLTVTAKAIDLGGENRISGGKNYHNVKFSFKENLRMTYYVGQEIEVFNKGTFVVTGMTAAEDLPTPNFELSFSKESIVLGINDNVRFTPYLRTK